MKEEFFQETTPFTKYFLEQEKNFRSPVFNRDPLQNQDDIGQMMRDQSMDPEQHVCKKLHFTPPHSKSPNQFQAYSPRPPTAKKAPIYVVSPIGRQHPFDQGKTQQRQINGQSPMSCYKMPDDLMCQEPDFMSEEEDDEVVSKFQSPIRNLCQSPQRKHSERAKNTKYLSFMTLKKPMKYASEQPRRRTNSKRRKLQTEQKPKIIVCNCKKSKCLKLYCDCFAAGVVCGKDCNCCSCHNNDDHNKERDVVIKQIMERNPSAFRPKVESHVLMSAYSQSNSEEEDQIDKKPRHFKGCNCKKSNCLKKYCECFQMNVKCSELCKCDDCKNCEQPVKKDPRKRIKYKDTY